MIQRHRQEIDFPYPGSCESITWRKATALILNNPAWRGARHRAPPCQQQGPIAARASRGCLASRSARMDLSTLALARSGLKSSCCFFSPRSILRGSPQRQELRFQRMVNFKPGRTGAYPFAKCSKKGNILQSLFGQIPLCF